MAQLQDLDMYTGFSMADLPTSNFSWVFADLVPVKRQCNFGAHVPHLVHSPKALVPSVDQDRLSKAHEQLCSRT